MKKALLVILVIGACGALVACEDSTSGAGPSASRSTDPNDQMWGSNLSEARYSFAVKDRIDGMEAARDCRGLQAEFDQADRNDDAQRARTGKGTSDLMGYIHDALDDAGCYG